MAGAEAFQKPQVTTTHISMQPVGVYMSGLPVLNTLLGLVNVLVKPLGITLSWATRLVEFDMLFSRVTLRRNVREQNLKLTDKGLIVFASSSFGRFRLR